MTLLLLAGTGASRQIAERLQEKGTDFILSQTRSLGGQDTQFANVRIGGFGGEAGFRDFLTTAQISAVLDATHPFASQISQRTARVCAELALPYCQHLRPEWTPDTGDQWVCVDSESEASAHIPKGAVVFLTTGRQTLAGFENLQDRRLICRQIDPPQAPFPFPNGEYLIGTPPFSVEDEIALFQRLGVDWLVTKNAGGSGPESKLLAARALKIPVLMINRPAQPEGLKVRQIEDALAWVEQL